MKSEAEKKLPPTLSKKRHRNLCPRKKLNTQLLWLRNSTSMMRNSPLRFSILLTNVAIFNENRNDWQHWFQLTYLFQA